VKSPKQLAKERYPSYLVNDGVHHNSIDIAPELQSAFIAGYTANRWIDVKERLPTNKDAYGRYGHVNWLFDDDSCASFSFDKRDWSDNPTHWQPIIPLKS
jgi:hypothetical protein